MEDSLSSIEDRDEGAEPSRLYKPSDFEKLIKDSYFKSYAQNLATKMLADRSRVDDLIQETVLRLWGRADQIEDRGMPLVVIAYKTVRNIALDWAKRLGDKRTPIPVADMFYEIGSVWSETPHSLDPMEVSDFIRTREILMGAIACLKSDTNRRILLARFFGEQTTAEITSTVGTVSDGATKTAQYRALAALHSVIVNEWGMSRHDLFGGTPAHMAAAQAILARKNNE